MIIKDKIIVDLAMSGILLLWMWEYRFNFDLFSKVSSQLVKVIYSLRPNLASFC